MESGSLESANGAILNFRREKQAVDVAFRSILWNANRELAKLLRDVGKKTPARPQRRTHNQRVSELLKRAVHCAAKQYMLQAELGNFALKDELTGFYNRRGFLALAERQLKLGRRANRGMLLFFIDVDGLKEINDSCGHSEGDRALKRVSETLRMTFRDSDIIARLGGDEFAVLAVEALDHSETTILARLRNYLKTVNAGQSKYAISLSVGTARFDHGNPNSVRKLLAQADQAMYEQKRSRAGSRIAEGEVYLC
jgi:diguanylate cyclase (GGDEF)-like protein